MPYKDVERRRQFQKAYKRKWRKTQEKINPLRAFRVYVCPRFPFLWMTKEQFVNGLLVTSNRATQIEIEAHREFGKFIFPLSISFSGPILEDEDE